MNYEEILQEISRKTPQRVPREISDRISRGFPQGESPENHERILKEINKGAFLEFPEYF